MNCRNDETGELAPGHCIGVDEDGDKLYVVPQGWTPVEPYWLDGDGYAHAGEPSQGPADEDEREWDDPNMGGRDRFGGL